MKINIIEKHFDEVANNYDYYKKKNSFYYQNLKRLLASLIPEKSDVLEFGCGTGDLLASLKPKRGIGFDISSNMVRIATSKYNKNRHLHFVDHLPLTFHLSPDFVFMSDVIEHLENPSKDFEILSKLMSKKSKLIITMANPIWEPFLIIAEKLRLKMPEGPHRRIKYKDIKTLSEQFGLKITRHDYKLLIPLKLLIITNFVNKYLEKIFKPLCFIEFFVCEKV